jgi:hypothetical protein
MPKHITITSSHRFAATYARSELWIRSEELDNLSPLRELHTAIPTAEDLENRVDLINHIFSRIRY